MAAPWLNSFIKHIHVRLYARRFCLYGSKNVLLPQNISRTSRGLIRYIVLSAVAFTTDAAAKTASPKHGNYHRGETGSMNFEPNDPRLRSHECLKNAAGLSVDSTSAVLSQTVYAVTKIEKEYVDLVNVLIVLMEYQLQVLGHTAEEERIGDLIVQTRHEINKVKQRKEDLRLLFSSVEKLADATAEVAFAAGSEYASTSAGERLYSAQKEVRRVQTESAKVEQRLHEAQARSVEMLSQLEEQRQAELETTEQEFPSVEDSLGPESESETTPSEAQAPSSPSSSEPFTQEDDDDDDLSGK